MPRQGEFSDPAADAAYATAMLGPLFLIAIWPSLFNFLQPLKGVVYT